MSIPFEGPTTLTQARKRRYNVWGGNPAGNAYREGYCAQQVTEPGCGRMSYQCRRTSGYGPALLYCKQHDPANIVAREQAATKKYNDDQDRQDRLHDIYALSRAAQLLGRSDPSAAKACRDLANKKKERK